ncbi:MAG: hypothetical protein MZU91_02525 [Desulfosudis oleivorans]|nr:hypothetical protein [Desulfosudis oleivorans]
MDKGGPREAAIRALIYIRLAENAADERGLEVLRRIRAEHGAQLSLPEFKQIIRDQYLMLMLDERRAVDTIPVLLKGHETKAQHLLEHVRQGGYRRRGVAQRGAKAPGKGGAAV